MSSSAKARCIAVVLAAVLLLAAVVPAQAAVPGSRGMSSSVIDALWSWLGAAWEAFVPVGLMEKEGALIDPNGGETVQSTSDQGSGIDPNGGRP